MNPRARDLIEKFKLVPHPEGGYFSEVFRSQQTVYSSQAMDERPALTHIYFLLLKGQISRFHRVLHEEIWNFYEGSPLRLILFNGKTPSGTFLGGQQHHYAKVIPGNCYQAAESTGDFTLVGCSVAPGFDFKDFSFMPEKSPEAVHIKKHFGDLERFI